MQILRSADPPWGDYGAILWHGLVHRASAENSPLELDRAGPFVPPISFPWPTVVVVHSVREQLQALAVSGCSFRPVVPVRVVSLAWHEWDPGAEEPRLYPAGGEPENYILKRRHSAELCSQLPTLWELAVPDAPGLQRGGGAFDPSHYSGQDICRASRFGHLFVSDRLASWLQSNLGPWVSLHPIQIAG